MPKARLNVCSFYVLRPNENPRNHDYLPMLRLLQKSCDALGLRHVVLTDVETAATQLQGFECFDAHLPPSLMQSCTEIQAQWIERGDWQDGDTLTVGADCLVLRDPNKVFPSVGIADLCVTLRPQQIAPKYPINTGAIMLRALARADLAAMFRNIADTTGTRWCDDQRAIERALSPLPPRHCVTGRQGLRVAFLPLPIHNHTPAGPHDPARRACVLHFRGKSRKFMPEWAAKNRPEWLT